MSEILSFLRAIAGKPDDESRRLIFADWLDEHGDWRAEFFRLDFRLRELPADAEGRADLQSRWEELWSRLSPSWRTIVGRSPVENCSLSFTFRCPKQWEKLQQTEVAAVRFCDSCSENVFYCDTIAEAREHAVAGHCVAVDAAVARSPDDLADNYHHDRLLGILDMGSLDGADDK